MIAKLPKDGCHERSSCAVDVLGIGHSFLEQKSKWLSIRTVAWVSGDQLGHWWVVAVIDPLPPDKLHEELYAPGLIRVIDPLRLNRIERAFAL